MHFRIRGNSVQIVRTIHDPDTGRSISQPAGSAHLLSGEINERARATLTEEEIATAERWLQKKRELRIRKREITAQSLPEILADVTGWVNDADQEDVRVIADELLFGMADLRRALTAKVPPAK